MEKALITTRKRAVKKISLAQATQAAQDAGYECVEVKAVNAAGMLGKYFEQDVIKTLAPAVLVRTMEELRQGIQHFSKLLELSNEEAPPELKAAILATRGRYIEHQIAVAKALQEAAVLIGKTVPTAAALNPSFGPREQVVPSGPVQVNIGIRSNGDVQIDGQEHN